MRRAASDVARELVEKMEESDLDRKVREGLDKQKRPCPEGKCKKEYWPKGD